MKITSPLFFTIALILVGLNLRPALVAIGPLLDQIRFATGLTFQGSGLLTTLPIFMFGILALCGGLLYRIGMYRGIIISLVLIMFACGIREIWHSSTALLMTAAMAGVGIGAIQVLVPGFIKYVAPKKTDQLMGIYITAILGGGTIAAMFSPQIAEYWGWSGALAGWGLLAFLTLFIWGMIPAEKESVSSGTTYQLSSFIKNIRAWMLAIFFGLGASTYTFMLAWLSPFYVQQGWGIQASSMLLAGLHIASIAGGLVVVSFVSRWRDRRLPLFIAIGLLIIGILCLMLAPDRLAWVSITLMGVGIGVIFPLSLIVTLDYASDPQQAGLLAAFVQGVGYIIGSFMPDIAGLLRDILGDFRLDWGVMLLLILPMLVIARLFSPESRSI